MENVGQNENNAKLRTSGKDTKLGSGGRVLGWLPFYYGLFWGPNVLKQTDQWANVF